ncbi:hypothetical protein WT08_00255 [Burkholderia sp. MSMB1552]|nr:hypothetical protein WT08_00255 [Burkholderia sp. MSMB1552]KWZ50481.1 hypothetical protein WS92_24125 [Burkholderia sp. MSMB1588]
MVVNQSFKIIARSTSLRSITRNVMIAFTMKFSEWSYYDFLFARFIKFSSVIILIQAIWIGWDDSVVSGIFGI